MPSVSGRREASSSFIILLKSMREKINNGIVLDEDELLGKIKLC